MVGVSFSFISTVSLSFYRKQRSLFIIGSRIGGSPKCLITVSARTPHLWPEKIFRVLILSIIHKRKYCMWSIKHWKQMFLRGSPFRLSNQISVHSGELQLITPGPGMFQINPLSTIVYWLSDHSSTTCTMHYKAVKMSSRHF